MAPTLSSLSHGDVVELAKLGVVTVESVEAPQGPTLGVPRVRLQYRAYLNGVLTTFLRADTPVKLIRSPRADARTLELFAEMYG